MQMGPAFLLWVALEQINIPTNPFLLRMGKHVLPRLGNVGQHVSAASDHGTREENTGKGPFRLSLLHTDHRGRAMTCLTISVVGLAGPIANSPKGGFKKDLELRCWVGSEDVLVSLDGVVLSISPLWLGHHQRRSEQLQKDGT